MGDHVIKFDVAVSLRGRKSAPLLLKELKESEKSISSSLKRKKVNLVRFSKRKGIGLDPHTLHFLVTIAVAAGTKLTEILTKQIVDVVVKRIEKKSRDAKITSKIKINRAKSAGKKADEPKQVKK